MGDMQTTFVMIKPDGVQRGLVADIIGRFETKGLRMVGLRQLIPSLELAETHYEIHKERPFYGGLIEFITSGPVVAMAWTGVDAISVARNLIGPTDGRGSRTRYDSWRLRDGHWTQRHPRLGWGGYGRVRARPVVPRRTGRLVQGRREAHL